MAVLEVDLPTSKPNCLHSMCAAIVLLKTSLLLLAEIHQLTLVAAVEDLELVLSSLSVVLMHSEVHRQM